MMTFPMGLLRECSKCGREDLLPRFNTAPDCEFGKSRQCAPCVKASSAATRKHRNKHGSPKKSLAWNNLEFRATRSGDFLFYRKCKSCSLSKPLCEFAKARTVRFGRTHKCLVCRNEQNIAALDERMLDPEYAEFMRTRQLVSHMPEEKRLNRRAKGTLWRENNKDRLNEEQRNRYASDLDYRAEIILKQFRRQEIPQEDVDVPAFGECEYCGQEKPLTVEHMIPRNFYFQGWVPAEIVGKAKNAIGACEQCNKSKADRLPDRHDFLETVAALLGYDPRERFEDKHFWEPPVLR